ncbi:hypothetical protein [Sandarakinorhabdus sp.]|uniref:hypothetical protein n=1 Tax=Sandarakinorhabdus sp. TaxID=1916663 RepID=UPI00286EB28D|nr:hypothetical protein [Sandarakinorhabdus sp.]
MDDRARQRLNTALKYFADEAMRTRVSRLDAVMTRFSINNRMGSHSYEKAIVDTIGECLESFVKETHHEVTKICKSRECFDEWFKYIIDVETVSFDGWESVIAPPASRYGRLTDENRKALEVLIASWSRRVGAYVSLAEFDFDDLPEYRTSDGKISASASEPALSTAAPVNEPTTISSSNAALPKVGRPPSKSHQEVADRVKATLMGLSDADFKRVVGVYVQECMSLAHIEIGETPFVALQRAHKLLREVRALRAEQKE